MNDIEQILGDGGVMSRVIADYTQREQQIKISTDIQNNMNTKGVLLVEAPCGCGKSMAYLVPAFLAAISMGQKTVISTHTISLQDQLMTKDTKLAANLFGEAGKNVKVAQMKGRSNYLCNVAIANARQDLTLLNDPVFKKLNQWAEKTKTGDKAELTVQCPNWEDLTATSDTCAKAKCPLLSSCYYYKQKALVAEADIIVVNHALFFADLVNRKYETGEDGNEKCTQSILPEYDNVAIDEAHHTESVATDAFGSQVHNRKIPKILEKLEKLHEVKSSDIEAARLASDQFFGLYEKEEQTYIVRRGEKEGDAISTLTYTTAGIVNQLEKKSADMNRYEIADTQQIDAIAVSLKRAAEEIDTIYSAPNSGNVKWGSTTQVGHKKYKRVEINLTPINVSDYLRDYLWNRYKDKVSITLVSATLATGGSFDYLKSRLGIKVCNETIVGSPFNFKENALLYVPAHMPEPSKTATPEYVEAVCTETKRLLELTEGRAFLLFTSRSMMNKVGAHLKGNTEHPLFMQGDMGNNELLKMFRQTKGAVLLGVASFWEGIDVQGEQLSLLVIDRVPFAVPDSPVQRAKMASVEGKGGNGFKDYSIPQAIIKLNQGVGRLIRTVNDRGIVCVLDTRLLTKKYGAGIVKSLPPMSKASKWETVLKFWSGG